MAKKFYPKKYWEAKIEEWQKSGKNAQIWCQENQIVYTTFLGWRNRLQVSKNPSFISDAGQSKNHFIELKDKPKDSSGIILEYFGVHIHLATEFDPNVLELCLKTLRGAVC